MSRDQRAGHDILAAVDLTDDAGAVVEAAARVALSTGVGLHVVHVAAGEPVLAGYDRGPVATHTRDERAGELTDEHAWLRELASNWSDDDLTVVPLVLLGSTVESILTEAERLDAPMIVVGRHAHGHLHHLVLGSVSEGIVRHATRPVLVVPVRAT